MRWTLAADADAPRSWSSNVASVAFCEARLGFSSFFALYNVSFLTDILLRVVDSTAEDDDDGPAAGTGGAGADGSSSSLLLLPKSGIALMLWWF